MSSLSLLLSLESFRCPSVDDIKLQYDFFEYPHGISQVSQLHVCSYFQFCNFNGLLDFLNEEKNQDEFLLHSKLWSNVISSMWPFITILDTLTVLYFLHSIYQYLLIVSLPPNIKAL